MRQSLTGHALYLGCLPLDLDEHDITEASTLLHELSNYLSSEQCLRWVETAVIINYVAKWSQLLSNAETCLAIPKEKHYLTNIPAFQTYQDARTTFLTDYTYLRTACQRTRPLFPEDFVWYEAEPLLYAGWIPDSATGGQIAENWP